MAHRIKFQLFVLAFQVFHYLVSNCLSISLLHILIYPLFVIFLQTTTASTQKERNSFLKFLFFVFFFFYSLKYPFSQFAVKTEFCFQGLFWTLFSFSSHQLPAIYPQNESFIFGSHCMFLIPLALILVNCSLISCLNSIFRLPCIDPSFQLQ